MTMNPRIALLLAGVLLILSNPCALAHTDVTAEQARELIDSTPDLTVVDVRERHEYCDVRGHIPGAVNYPWSSGVLGARYEELPTDGPVLVVCRSGGRSNAAASFLDSKGFSTVYDMLGGMSAWQWETAPCKYSGGNGTAADPYQIATAADLIALGETPEDYDKHFILTADIDLDPNLPGRKVFDRAVIAPDTDATKNSFQGTRFTGVLDGNGHTISNLTIRGASHLGLFGELNYGAKISNLGLEAVNVNGTRHWIGGLVGNNGGSIIMSHSTGTVSGYEYVGGLAGRNSGSITTSYNTGAVSGEHYVGGLVGRNFGSIATSYSTGAVSGNEDVGGLVGDSRYGIIAASFWDTRTSGQAPSNAGTGLTTAEMQDIDTYLNAGWDFVDEIRNGTCDYWQIPPGDYPRLRYRAGDSPVMPEGLGTAEKPYLIRDVRDLGIVWFKPSAHYRLEASLDLYGITWSMAVVPWFEGTFDGNGYVISNLHVQGGGYLGQFGHLVSEAKVSNLGLEAVDVNGTGHYVGGLAGRIGSWESKGAALANCYSTGTVTGSRQVGGLLGDNFGSVTTSYSTCTVTGEWYVGGLIGNNGTSDSPMVVAVLTDCYSAGKVHGDHYVGGLVGANGGSIATSYSTGEVNGDEDVGGLVGRNYGDVTTSFWDIETSGQSNSASGTGLATAEMMDPEMLGLNGLGNNPNWVLDAFGDYPHLAWEGTIGDMIPWPVIHWLDGNGTVESPYQIATVDQLSRLSRAGALTDRHFILVNDLDLSGLSWSQAVIPYFTGCFDGNGFILHHLHIQGTNDLGLIGHLGRDAIITNLGLKDVSVEGTDNVGSLVGRNNGSISNSYSTGTITGEWYVGGLVGSNGLWGSDCGRVTRCYSSGTLSGTEWAVGGLVGFNFCNVSQCYSTGAVNGSRQAGGLVGGNTDTVTDCFWDIETSGQTISDGGTGKTTAQMQTASTFLDAGWDFVDETTNGTDDFWWILEGQDYPRLWWEAGN